MDPGGSCKEAEAADQSWPGLSHGLQDWSNDELENRQRFRFRSVMVKNMMVTFPLITVLLTNRWFTAKLQNGRERERFVGLRGDGK